MTLRLVVALFVRALGAFQAGVAAHLLLPPVWKIPPLVTAGAVGVLVFRVGHTLRYRGSVREVVARGYLLPLAVPAAANLAVTPPPTWAAVGGTLGPFLGAVYAGTPGWVYLLCLAYACLAAERQRDPGFYR